jgi:hypothetical protein
MADFDVRRLREIAAWHGIRMSTDDPALAIVTLNQFVLEEAMKTLGNQVREATERIDKAGLTVQTRSGSILAQEVRLCAGAITQELHDEIDVADQRAQKMAVDLHQAYSKASLYRSLPVGLFRAVILLGCGLDGMDGALKLEA